MQTQLPQDLASNVTRLLMPHLVDRDERESLFIETYSLRDPRPLNQISFESSPEIFVTRCIADLIRFGCLATEGESIHALAALLLTIRNRTSVENHPEIDLWVSILNSQCEPTSTDSLPIRNPIQTIDTPLNERVASVFISYSHVNEEFATQLIADLGGAGHRCWIDTSKIKGGADWQQAIVNGIHLSYAVVVICSRQALESEYMWDEIQWARTRHKLIIPVLLEDVTDDDRFFGLHHYQGIRFDKLAHPQAIAALIAALPTPPQIDPSMPPRSLTQREHELAYLDRLRFEDFRLERFELAEYASLAGEAQVRREVRDPWDALAMKQEFAVIRPSEHTGSEIDAPPEKFTDAVSKITELRRVAVLGDPGAGKTHTLRAIAKPLYSTALTDANAPIPLLVNFGNWDKPDQPFETFLRAALGELGAHLDSLFEEKRAILLLDGLNEFPADQRAAKYPQVEVFIKAHPDAMAVVTCRQADYPSNLNLNQVMIRPLDPLRIRDFARRALHAIETDDAFFWELIGTDGRQFEARFKLLFANKLPAWESIFWLADMLPAEAKWEREVVNTIYYGWNEWLTLRDNPASILTLARNPYMLRMLLDVYIQFKGKLPANRGQLFEQLVYLLLRREKLAKLEPSTNTVILTDEGQALLAGLQRLALEMQVRRAGQSEESEVSVTTSLSVATTSSILNEHLLYLAVSASILESGDEVRFTHQLLQEYFTTRATNLVTQLLAGSKRSAEHNKLHELEQEKHNTDEASGEDVCFTQFYSPLVDPHLSALLHVYIHLQSALQQVHTDFRNRKHFTSPTLTLTEKPVFKFKRGTTFTVIPIIEGARVKPSRIDIVWEDNIEHIEFEIKLGAETPLNIGFRGEVRIYAGSVVIAQLPLLFTTGTLKGQNTYIYRDETRLRYKKIFVSYSRKDIAIVKAIDHFYSNYPELETYIDYKFLQASDYWWERVKEKIQEAEALQLFWSSNAAASENVAREWRYALDLPRPIVPIILEPKPAIPNELKDIHFQDYDTFVDRL